MKMSLPFLFTILMVLLWSCFCKGSNNNRSHDSTYGGQREDSLDNDAGKVISSYRLGDLVLLQLSDSEKMEILQEHPQSIGSEFILNRNDPNNNHRSGIDVVTEIVLRHIKQHSNQLPSDISESIVIHLRLGDVVAGNEYHEKQKRPLAVEYLKTLIANDTTSKRYVIGKAFFAKTSSTNYDECTRLSDSYLQNVLDELQAEHLQSESADIDLCCAVKAKLFIPGRGFFSRLIVEIRKKLHLESIETSTHD